MADADLVITGTVLTVDDARPTAQALAVAGGRIVAVGDRADVAGLIGPGTRTAPSGRVLAPEERLTVEQAIRAQTIDAAWQLFADDVIGSLEVGKYADLVVLSADPRAMPPEKIAELDISATFLAGRQVYQQ
jgi:predicted amidohydrolase YtcJ